MGQLAACAGVTSLGSDARSWGANMGTAFTALRVGSMTAPAPLGRSVPPSRAVLSARTSPSSASARAFGMAVSCATRKRVPRTPIAVVGVRIWSGMARKPSLLASVSTAPWLSRTMPANHELLRCAFASRSAYSRLAMTSATLPGSSWMREPSDSSMMVELSAQVGIRLPSPTGSPTAVDALPCCTWPWTLITLPVTGVDMSSRSGMFTLGLG